MFYSKSTNGFYDKDIHANQLPQDIVEITQQQHIALLQGQAEGKTIISDSEGRPTLSERPSQTKDSVWKHIQIERDRRTHTGGYKVNNKWFHNDPQSRSQQLSLVLMGDNLPPELQWKTMDGTFVMMTPELAREILKTMIAHDQKIFTIAEAHKHAMEASVNPADYDFSTGWPPVFTN